MADKAMDVYLNDHLGGAMLGSDLAKHLKDNAPAPLGDVMIAISLQIEEDRETLVDLMDRMGTTRNPVKQVTAWIAEKASWVKFSGLPAGDRDVGLFMALESLSLGVEGKACLWRALNEVKHRYPALQSTDLPVLIDRAEAQRRTLEEERLSLARALFSRQAKKAAAA
jgi:hypothetical protein